mmetsp:Transcript_82307/g.212095  ORF Transcript_82307/g.212095 Transcript_82307/m.212095 type:complete len:257 (-) Transcript_82307:487-1257(-)
MNHSEGAAPHLLIQVVPFLETLHQPAVLVATAGALVLLAPAAVVEPVQHPSRHQVDAGVLAAVERLAIGHLPHHAIVVCICVAGPLRRFEAHEDASHLVVHRAAIQGYGRDAAACVPGGNVQRRGSTIAIVLGLQLPRRLLLRHFCRLPLGEVQISLRLHRFAVHLRQRLRPPRRLSLCLLRLRQHERVCPGLRRVQRPGRRQVCLLRLHGRFGRRQRLHFLLWQGCRCRRRQGAALDRQGKAALLHARPRGPRCR